MGLQDALSYLGSSNQACLGSKMDKTLWHCRQYQSALGPGLFIQFLSHATVSSLWLSRTSETLVGLLAHTIWPCSCYQIPKQDSFLPVGNGQSPCRLPSHAQELSGCQVAWVRSVPRTSQKGNCNQRSCSACVQTLA